MTKANVKLLGQRMLHYFRGEDPKAEGGLPSFVRFAAKERISMHELRRLCEKNKSFARIYDECEETLCDKIADGALHKRLDGSFAKFLLAERYGYTKKKEEAEESYGVTISLSEPS